MFSKKLPSKALLFSLLLPVAMAFVDDELADGMAEYRGGAARDDKPTYNVMKDSTNTRDETVDSVLRLLKRLRQKKEPSPVYYISLKDLVESARRNQGREMVINENEDAESADQEKLTLRSLNDVLLNVQSYLKASMPSSDLNLNSTLNLVPHASGEDTEELIQHKEEEIDKTGGGVSNNPSNPKKGKKQKKKSKKNKMSKTTKKPTTKKPKPKPKTTTTKLAAFWNNILG